MILYPVGGLEHVLPYIGKNHRNWRTHIFQRDRVQPPTSGGSWKFHEKPWFSHDFTNDLPSVPWFSYGFPALSIASLQASWLPQVVMFHRFPASPRWCMKRLKWRDSELNRLAANHTLEAIEQLRPTDFIKAVLAEERTGRPWSGWRLPELNIG